MHTAPSIATRSILIIYKPTSENSAHYDKNEALDTNYYGDNNFSDWVTSKLYNSVGFQKIAPHFWVTIKNFVYLLNIIRRSVTHQN